MEDLEYIKKFSKITVKDICKKNKVNKSNLYAGRTAKKNVKLIRKSIECELAKLYVEEYQRVQQEDRKI